MNLYLTKKDHKNETIRKHYHTYRGYVITYNADIFSSFNPKLQLKNTKSATENKLKYLLSELRESIYVMTLVIEFEKIERDDATKNSTFDPNPKAETVINEGDTNVLFQSIYSPLHQKYKQKIGKGVGWIIDAAVNRTNNISMYNTLAGSSHIKLLKELDHPKNDLLLFKY